MPRTALVAESASRIDPYIGVKDDPGAPFVAVDDVNGMSFVNNMNRSVLIVKNENAANSLVVTIPMPTTQKVAGIQVPDEVVTIPAEEEAYIGPFGAEWHQDTSKTVHLNFSGTAPDGKIMQLNVAENNA